MKKALFFLLLSAQITNGLAAQSVNDFIIVQSAHVATNSRMTLEAMANENIPLMFAAFERENRRVGFASFREIKEKTRLEEQLVSRARRELPDSPSKGSVWLVVMERRSSRRVEGYLIIFFVNQDGRVYHWMLYCSN
jgi:hypothetical protein